MPRKRNTQVKPTQPEVTETAKNAPVDPAANEALKDTKLDLIVAIEKGDLAAVKKLIAEPDFFEYSYKDKEGNTPLHYVDKIKDDKVRNEIAKALIYAGMDIKLRNDKDEKPEHYKDYKKIKEKSKSRLMSDFANLILIKPKGHERKIALALFLQLAIYLIAPAYALTFFAVWVAQVMLGMIVEANDKQLLQKRQHQQLEGDFIRAIADNKLDSVKLVKYIEQGVNIHHLTNSSRLRTALEETVRGKNIEQFKFLLPYSTNEDVARALSVAAYRKAVKPVNKDSDAFFEQLLTFVDKDSLTMALACSVALKSSETVQFLLERGAKVAPIHIKFAKDAKIKKILEDAQKSATTPALVVDTSKEPVGKVSKVVTPHFESKIKAAVPKAPAKAKATKQADNVNDRKRTLRSHTNK